MYYQKKFQKTVSNLGYYYMYSVSSAIYNHTYNTLKNILFFL